MLVAVASPTVAMVVVATGPMVVVAVEPED
jgi:hypothetical protein